MGHLSDHCLISLGLKCNFKTTASCNSRIYKLEKNFKWDTQSELIYKSTLVSSSVDEKIKDTLISGSDMTVEDMTNHVNDILLNSEKQALQQKKHMKRSAKKKNKMFDKDCFSLKKEAIKLSRQLCRANATHETRILFFQKKKELRRLIKTKKKSFKQHILDQLNDMSDSNPKRYWNLVKELKELDANSVNGTNPISPEDWLKHLANFCLMIKRIGAHYWKKESMRCCPVILFLIWNSISLMMKSKRQLAV